MSEDLPYHYTAELLSLMIDTTARLNRGKRGLLLFFRSAGVPDRLLDDLDKRVATDRDGIKKREIAEAVLTRLNEGGDPLLRPRREVLKRVIEFEAFSTCWPQDELAARGLVAQVRDAVNRTDAFTRMKQQAEAERQERAARARAELEEVRRRRQEIEAVRRDLTALFGMANAQRRGKQLEPVLNRLCKAEGIGVRESFTLSDDSATGVTEQIDGLVELDGELYLVEMKWWQERLGPEALSGLLSKLFIRGDARGIIISASGFTEAGILSVTQALGSKTVVLVELDELVQALERDYSIRQLLKEKVRAAIADKNPLFRPLPNPV